MIYRLMVAGVIVLNFSAGEYGAARAGDAWTNCGGCENGAVWSRSVVYAQPTYVYARPTVTIVPRVVVQPNYFVERTYVVSENRFVREAAPCWLGCDPHRMIDQGQYVGGRVHYETPAFEEPYPVNVITNAYRYRRHFASRRRPYGLSRSYYGPPRPAVHWRYGRVISSSHDRPYRKRTDYSGHR